MNKPFKQIYTNLLLYTVFIILFLCSHSLQAQSVYHISTDNGLPNNYVRGVIQDKYGYIWMATTSGLARYDGYSIDVLKPTESGNRKLMQDFRVQDIKNWQNKFIWVRLRGKLYCCYDVDLDKFVDYTGNGSYNDTYDKYEFLSSGDLVLYDQTKGLKRIHYDGKTFTSRKTLLPAKNVITYIGTEKTEYIITEDGKIYHYQNHQFKLEYTSYLTPSVRKITGAGYHKGIIYLATNDGIYEYGIQKHTLYRSAINPPKPHIVKDNKGNLIILTKNGSELFYLTQHKTYHIKGIYNEELLRLNSDPHYNFFTAHNGTLWISTYGNGLMSFDVKSGKLKSYSNLLTSPYSIHVFEDKSGNIWDSQENMGVCVINLAQKDAQYIYDDTYTEICHQNDIRLLKRVGNQIYIANMQNGLLVVNGVFKGQQQINSYHDDVTCMTKDNIGNLWIGTRKNGVYRDTKNFRHNDRQQSISDGKVSDIVVDKRGRVWISMFDNGIDLYQKGKFVHIISNKQFQPRKMTLDEKGNIWVCTSQGALCFNTDKIINTSKAYHFVNVSTGNPQADEIHSIFIDSKKRVWIASIGSGVKMIHNSDTMQFTTREGLADDNVQSIVEDKNGYIWFGTDNGISKWNSKRCQDIHSIPQGNSYFKNYFFGGNSLANSCTENNALLLSDGRLAFATHHGIAVFNPQNIHETKPKFALAITNIMVNGTPIHEMPDGQTILDSAVVKSKNITVAHQQNSLTFYFSDFDYSTLHHSKFTYYLEGYDSEWSNLSNINFAQYRNLPSGNYILHVRSCNANGVWSPDEATLLITVRPPFWAVWWAFIIYLTLAAGIILFLYKNFQRINNLRNKVLIENQLTEYKLRFFTNISHEFRTPLTIIRGDMERLRTIDKVPGEMKQPLSSMEKSVNRMMRLINQLLEFRKMQNNKLQLALEKTDVIPFIQDIYLHFRGMAENKNINLQFLPFDKSYEMYIDKGYLDKITYNLISNALKYTQSKGNVSIRVSLSQDKLFIISVEDTGVGITKEQQDRLFQQFNQSNYSHDSMGIGLYLTAELVKVHHGKISYRVNIPQGSIFRVELPTSKDVYRQEDFLDSDNAVLKEENERTTLPSDYYEMPFEPMNHQRILIVEDDDDIRNFVKCELQRFFHIDTAIDGLQAFEKMKQNKPDLLISDVLMPNMDGYELTRKVRTEQELSDIPIILLTALTAEDKQMKGMTVGADAYIEKPFSIRLLIAKCCQLLEQRNHLKATYAQATNVSPSPLNEIFIDEQDLKFQKLLDTWLNKHLSDPQLNIDTFAESMGYGRTSFYKKIKKITGSTPNEYIRTLRMNKAAELLHDDRITIAEVGYQIGMNDPYYFSKLFKNFFGMSPSKYRSGEKK